MTETRILSGDCLEVMKTLPSNSINAIIADPPYCSGGLNEVEKTSATSQGVSRKNQTWFVGDAMGSAGYAWLMRAVATQALRLLKSDGHLLMFCDWRMLATLSPALESAGFRHRNTLIWDKLTPGMGYGFRGQHEIIVHMTGVRGKVYAHCGNVLRVKRVTPAKRLHRTEKPQDLLKALIRVVSTEGDTLLDPFCGSGSLCLAANQMGRNAIGIELCENMAKVAQSRIKEESDLNPI